MARYKVEYMAIVTGTAVVEAENVEKAKKKVRKAIQPDYTDILNDELESSEKYILSGKREKK